MSSWAGPLHGLVELRCLSGLSEQPDDEASLTVGLSGRRRARVTPRVARSWSCQLGIGGPSDVALLQELYWAHRGEAVWLVTEAARAQNVLPPPLVVLDRARGVMVPAGWESVEELTAAGVVATADGPAAASVLVAGGGAVGSPVVPVVPGLPVTVSAYVATGGAVSLVWVDSAGVETTEAASAAATADGGRVVVSVPVVPAGRSACRLVVAGASWFARGQVTWTTGPVPYVTGRGAPQVLLGPVREDVVMALPDGSRSLSSFSYTVSEVG